MRKRDVCFFVLSFLMLMFAHSLSSFAIDREDKSSLGCSDGIVNMGDTESEVIEKCGEPTRKERSSPSDHFTLPEPNIWVYDFGSSSFVYYLTFTRGKVERIQTGGYGN
jgi:hypothetical protein